MNWFESFGGGITASPWALVLWMPLECHQGWVGAALKYLIAGPGMPTAVAMGLGLVLSLFFFSTSIYLVLTDEGSDNFGVGENIFFSNFLHFFFPVCLPSEAYMEKSCMKLPICSQPSEYWGGQGSLQVTRCFLLFLRGST